MTSLRMALSELRRITAGRLPKAALIAMALIPTIYAGLYLYANHDPYAALKNVPAALVVQDTGATTSGKTINVGKEVAAELASKHDFDWHLVSAKDAQDGITHGKYDFGITIPADFSSALTSSARLDPQQAQLIMTTNDANSYLSTTIANTVTEKVRAALVAKVGTQAADQFLTGLGTIRTSLIQAADGASQLHDGVVKAAAGASQLKSGSAQLSTGASKLSSGLETMRSQTASLPSKTKRLADGARQVAQGDAQIAAIGDRVGSVANTLV
ncbi:MAG TPA: YhgE/Pip family protein, partial [Marmoricola sp.]|nr:YhgE/Pip family protein [Marmoricola sp.]